MVKPTSASAGEPPKQSASLPSKPHDLRGLAAVFRAVLAAGPAWAPERSGQSASFAHLVPARPSGGSGAIRAAFARNDDATRHDELDPLARSLATPAALMPAPGLVPAHAVTTPRSGITQSEIVVVEEVVRRVAWGGDRRRGVARIELGGEHAGTAIVVTGDGAEVALRIDAARGPEADALGERLAKRLRARGVSVTGVEIG
jgi:hypothetical protein